MPVEIDPASLADNTTPEPVEAPAGEPAGTEVDTPPTDAPEGAGNAEETEVEDGEKQTLSPEDALSALKKVRQESANYRTRLRDVEAQLEKAKTPEQVEEIIAQIKADTANEARSLMIENVALAAKLPEDLTDLLKGFKGETREDFEAHAKILAKYAPSDDVTPELSGGLRPNQGGDDTDTAALAQQMRRRRY